MTNSVSSAPSLTGRGGVFYLHGADNFRKEAAAEALIAAHLDPATSDFNLDTFRGSEVAVETLASAIATPPMMSEFRVVVLRDTEAMASSARAREALVEAAQSPPPGLALILLCTVPEGSKARFYRDLAAHAQSTEFVGMSEDDVPGWLIERAREVHGVEMDPEAARALGGAVGSDLGVLHQELNKLASFVGEEGTITVEAVEAAGTRLPKQDRWQWFDLVGEGRFEEARQALPTLLGQGESGVGLVIGLGTHLLRLGVVREMGLGGLEEVLPPHQRWMARRMGPALQAQARQWTAGSLRAAVAGLLRADRLLKASGVSDEALLEEWLLLRMVGLHETSGRESAA